MSTNCINPPHAASRRQYPTRLSPVALVGVLSVFGCGGDGSPNNPLDASLPDTSVMDAFIGDSPADTSTDQSKPDAGSVQHPADKSMSVPHGVRACTDFVETDAPSLFGATPIPKGVTWISSGSVKKSFTDGTHLADRALGTNINTIYQYSFPDQFSNNGVGARARYFAGVYSYDSLLAKWSACPTINVNCGTPINPGSIGLLVGSNSVYSDNRIRPVTTGLAAADCVVGSASLFAVSGRIEQGTFDFDINQVGAFQASGPGVFVAQYTTNSKVITAKWVTAFPATTIPKISAGNQNDELFFGSRFDRDSSLTNYLLTIPFADTIDFGAFGKLTAPNGSYATAIVKLDKATGKVVWAQSFAKGPKSLGKVSRALALTMEDGTIFYFDTVWDTIDFGGGIIATASQGGDVVVAVLDAKGTLIKYWTYGGAGDDEAFDALVGKGKAYLVGRSSDTIDLGNGPLASGIWFADVTL